MPEPLAGSTARNRLRLTGRVVDEDLRPVAGAEVLISSDGTTTSADDGTFSLDDLVAGEHVLIVTKGDLTSGLVDVPMNDDTESVTVYLHRGVTLVLHVVELDGRTPIGGATVRANGREATTAPDGTVTFAGVDPSFVALRARAEGRGAVEHQLPIDEPPDRIVHHTMPLPRGARISGTVVDPDGKPLSSASVYVETIDTSVWHRDTSPIKTDATGAWKLNALASGTYALTAASRDFTTGPAVRIEVDGKTPRDGIVVRVDYGAQLVGTVFDAAGKPSPGAAVQLKSEGYWNAVADDDGVFRFLGVREGDYVLAASSTTQSSERYRVELIRNKRVDVELHLVESSIAGIVVDTNGKPVAGARVSVRLRNQFHVWGRRDLTDADGRFDVRGVPPGDYAVDARRADQQDGETVGPETTVQSGDRAVKLVLPGVTTVTGRVLLDGAPLRSFGLIVAVRDGQGDGNWRQTPPRMIHRDDGRFTQRGVLAAARTIVIGGFDIAHKVIDVDIPEGDVFDLGDINVDRGQIVRGRVTDASGAPVAGSTVVARQQPGVVRGDPDPLQRRMLGGATATTDEHGDYELVGIPPPVKYDYEASVRPNRISASHPTHGDAPARNLDPTTTRVNFVLSVVGGIDGKLVGAKTDFLYVLATSVDRAGEPTPTQIKSDRSFGFNGLPAGDYQLTLTKSASDGFTLPATRVHVQADRSVAVTIVVPETVTVTIKVVDGSCAHVKFIDLTSASATAPALGRATCDGAQAVMPGVPPGSYRACVDDGGCVPILVTALPAHQTIELRSRP